MLVLDIGTRAPANRAKLEIWFILEPFFAAVALGEVALGCHLFPSNKKLKICYWYGFKLESIYILRFRYKMYILFISFLCSLFISFFWFPYRLGFPSLHKVLNPLPSISPPTLETSFWEAPRWWRAAWSPEDSFIGGSVAGWRSVLRTLRKHIVKPEDSVTLTGQVSVCLYRPS